MGKTKTVKLVNIVAAVLFLLLLVVHLAIADSWRCFCYSAGSGILHRLCFYVWAVLSAASQN